MQGDAVTLLARGIAGLEAAAEDIRPAGGTPLVVPLDMADSDARPVPQPHGSPVAADLGTAEPCGAG
jgi:hypothetical protein